MELDSEKVKPGATVFAHRGRPRPFPVRGVSGEPPRTQQAHQGKGTSLGHWLAGLCFFFFFFQNGYRVYSVGYGGERRERRRGRRERGTDRGREVKREGEGKRESQ